MCNKSILHNHGGTWKCWQPKPYIKVSWCTNLRNLPQNSALLPFGLTPSHISTYFNLAFYFHFHFHLFSINQTKDKQKITQYTRNLKVVNGKEAYIEAGARLWTIPSHLLQKQNQPCSSTAHYRYSFY